MAAKHHILPSPVPLAAAMSKNWSVSVGGPNMLFLVADQPRSCPQPSTILQKIVRGHLSGLQVAEHKNNAGDCRTMACASLA